MITMHESQLQISIEHGSPQELRDDLIKAIAAAMRWAARDPYKYTADGENQYVLAQLLEELVHIE